ncbi:MAG: hypothetical protein GY941_18755, partial [Planctomycetes bacterium]|nr:hypothetical protein [Planctomycetota bacterium]
EQLRDTDEYKQAHLKHLEQEGIKELNAAYKGGKALLEQLDRFYISDQETSVNQVKVFLSDLASAIGGDTEAAGHISGFGEEVAQAVLDNFSSIVAELDARDAALASGNLNQIAEADAKNKIFLASILAGGVVKMPGKLGRSGGVDVPDKLTGRVAGEAAEIIASRPGELRNLVALSRSSVNGTDIGRSFTNLPGSIRSFPGIQNNKNGTFNIVDREAYINQVETLFKSDGNPLNSSIRERILNFVGQDSTRTFPTKGRGIPGLHSEVQAVNAALNKVPAGVSPSSINVSTIDLLPGNNQGLAFPACNNCGGILSGFNILTGVK